VHRQLGALDHGRGDSEFQRQASVHRLQRRKSPIGTDFWATWCQPCKKEMPGYQKLLDRYGSRGFAVVGLKSDIMADSVNPLQFAKTIGVRYPLVIASAELTHNFGGIEGLPTTMIYDRHGILRKKIIGFDYTESFEASLKPLL
jgi:thiol-disulfide isomerase/thioredoxin